MNGWCDMFDKLKGVEDRYHELERQLSDPKVVADRDAYQKYIREHAEISPLVAVFKEFKRVDRELDDSLDLLQDEDPDFLPATCSRCTSDMPMPAAGRWM